MVDCFTHRVYDSNISGRYDGAELVQYHTHVPGKVFQSQHFGGHQRADAEWQEYVYPASRRDLIYMQTPQKYTIGNSLVLARPFDPANYFVGYQAAANASVQSSGTSTSHPLGSGT
jgi:hypothetical protein